MDAATQPAAVAACVRCSRTEHEHLLWDRDQADEIQRRIWRAIGFPCAQFISDLAAIYSENQAATGRWAHGSRRQPAPASPRSDTYGRGAALAREALARRKEAS